MLQGARQVADNPAGLRAVQLVAHPPAGHRLARKADSQAVVLVVLAGLKEAQAVKVALAVKVAPH